MEFILNKNNVNIKGNPEGPAMVFIHGFGCDQNMWRFITPEFEEKYRIILLDLVGSGNSDNTTYSYARYETLDGHARDIIDIAIHLDLTDIILVAHSVSSMIGALIDIHQPSLISKLIMLGPSPCYLNDGDYKGGFDLEDIEGLLAMMESNYLGWSESLAPNIMGNPESPELGRELTESFCKTDPEIAKHFARVTFLSDNRSDMAKVKTDCLILQCSEDIIAPESVGKFLHNQIPNSHYVKLKATGHCPHMSAPEETIHYMNEFLRIAK